MGQLQREAHRTNKAPQEPGIARDISMDSYSILVERTSEYREERKSMKWTGIRGVGRDLGAAHRLGFPEAVVCHLPANFGLLHASAA